MSEFEKRIMANLFNAVSKFNPIGLSEMDEMALMNRIDTKYILPINDLPALLNRASDKYKILEIDSLRNIPYKTTYFDTDDYHFFRQHINGKLNRCKVRYRVYETSGLAFLEVKVKTNKKRTIKWRIENSWSPEQRCFNPEALVFLNEKLTLDGNLLKPIIENRFTRLTLVGVVDKERVTIDFNLSFADSKGNEEALPYLAIVELKQQRYNHQSPFVSILKQFNLSQTAFSKYCMGKALLHKHEYTNTLKANFIKLNKFKNEYYQSVADERY